MDALTSKVLAELFRHAVSWLVNLGRAGRKRKLESKAALRRVITASRETLVYIRRLKEKGERDYDVESRLAVTWTELGFTLEDLGLTKLAKRCSIKGLHWVDPDRFDRKFLEKADRSLEKMERLAMEALREIGS